MHYTISLKAKHECFQFGNDFAISFFCFQCSLLHRAKTQFRFRWQEYFCTWWLPVLFRHELYFLNSAVNIRALLLRYSSFFSFIKLHKSWLKRERMFGNVPYVNYVHFCLHTESIFHEGLFCTHCFPWFIPKWNDYFLTLTLSKKKTCRHHEKRWFNVKNTNSEN